MYLPANLSVCLTSYLIIWLPSSYATAAEVSLPSFSLPSLSCVSQCLPIHPSSHASIQSHLSLCLSVCPSVCLSVCPYVCMYPCLSISQVIMNSLKFTISKMLRNIKKVASLRSPHTIETCFSVWTEGWDEPHSSNGIRPKWLDE